MSAEAWFAELEDVHLLIPDYRRAYQSLNITFQTFLNEHTHFAGIRFSGPFAKTDYLLKEYRAPRYLQHSVNDARIHLHQMGKTETSVLASTFPHDFKAICQFVGLVCQVPVPAILEVWFPKEETRRQSTLKADYLRIIVNHWDDTFLYAHADAEGTDELKVFYGGKNRLSAYPDWDWSYLRELLKEGCQLNIIRPREEQGVLYPELFIWEPDYLVDISAVAACFENYAVSPLLFLLNKLQSNTCTQPMLLGHLASQFLDERLQSNDETITYEESIQTFFQGNALNLLTTKLSQDFHAQAQSQRRVIQETINKKLPEILHADGLHFDASEMMVEPSFFCEMLGLQGRMDFLQLDMKVLIEQKSGKAQFPETDPPKQLTKHYVQLLLYMLLIRYNYRSTYEKNHHLFAFLFYSKYQNGLLPLGFAPDLIFSAIRLRNEITASEYNYSHDGLSLLNTLSADSLNMNHVRGVLWDQYQKPQIEALLQPIRNASELERTYYLRFLKFLETEHWMSKVGGQTKENAGFADKWHSSLEDKLQAGNIYHHLELVSPAPTDSSLVDQVTLRFPKETDHEISNFRPGDIVILYPYKEGTEPDARRSMVFRATIIRISADQLLLNLRASQTNAHVFWYGGRQRWAIEHDFIEASYSSLYRGMQAFLTAPKERRDLLLLQQAPRTDKTLTLKGDYGDFNELALKAKQAQDLFLIIGPPGTGKTSYGLLNTLLEALASSDGDVLLLSYTNRAVDEICGKLTAHNIDFIRIGTKFSCEEAYRSYLLESRVASCSKLSQLREMIDRTRVFVGTTTALNANLNLFKLKSFDLAIIDEASQILEPHLIGLLSACSDDGQCAIRKMVLIGDHKQLPAVVQQREEESAVKESILQDIHLTNCRLSLFERLLKQYRHDPDLTYMLTRQGRMHHDIAQFPNTAFYQDQLQEVPLQHQNTVLPPKGNGRNGIEDLLLTSRLAFIAISETPQRNSDKVNSHEARAIAATVLKIYELNKKTFSPSQTVGVIVPYRHQIAEIRNHIETFGIPVLNDITIDTIERYQGSQRDYILYGFTVQRNYQLNFLTDNVFEEEGKWIDRKLNVAMTRARKHLLLFGNPKLLNKDAVFSQLITFAKHQHRYIDVPLEDYVNGQFTPSDF